jgi:hypothetical protein
LKNFAALSASAVLVWRTWAIYRRSRTVLYTLLFLLALQTTIDFFSISSERAVSDFGTNNCYSAPRKNIKVARLSEGKTI